MSAGQTAAYWRTYRRRRSSDPHLAARERARARESMRASRARRHAAGLSFAQLLASTPYDDPASLRHVLNEEIASGRIRYHASAKQYEIVRFAFPADLLDALAALKLGP